ncbi:hypothetical protein Y032_0009g578 [Ancylostoma ceylanicum]|uniref:Uncharacterized protein n=1 Tax=Ancylostoma ceylanicum TaxID=53326 RepID=A0A016VHX0_9BILA|nr:hypothetical protein Y032_0009g578 [Ancylostoma ceylanicum]
MVRTHRCRNFELVLPNYQNSSIICNIVSEKPSNLTHATVTKVDKSEYGVTYSLEHKEVYWPKNLDLPKKVFTPIPEYCGLAEDLAEGRDYLIGGKCVTHGSFDITYFS